MLLYESEPFESATTLSAPAALDLWFSTSAHDVDFFVVVFDRDPSGVDRALSGLGKMRMKYLHGWESPHPSHPGEVYHGKIDLRPFAHRFSKGHRIGILIRSEWFPSYERNLNTWRANQERDKDGNGQHPALPRCLTSEQVAALGTPGAGARQAVSNMSSIPNDVLDTVGKWFTVHLSP
jgi:predicted acyl esterase